MSSEENQGIGLCSLTYSAPALESTLALPVPASFYNPFPDFNDIAVDGSQSAFPRRAKYSLLLDSSFLPTARYVNYSELTDSLYFNMPSWTRDAIREEMRKNPRLRLSFPRDLDEPDHVTHVHEIFEIVHKRLTASHSKWALRTFQVARLYDTLEEILASNGQEQIEVPLIATTQGDELEKRWAATKQAFQDTLIQDEVVSLLGCVLSLDDFFSTLDVERFERQWIAEQDSELRDAGLPGFAETYRRVRNILHTQYPHLGRAGQTEVLIRDVIREESFNRVRPDLTDPISDLFRSIDSLDFDELCLLSKTSGVGFPAATVQGAIASDMLVQSRGKTFNLGLWKHYVGFELHLDGKQDAARVVAKPDARLLEIAGMSLDISKSALTAAAEYVILIESIRQQLCTGVGLRCPFWNGGECCGFKPRMQRVWNITSPWSPWWKHHWQRPPCFE